MTLPNFAKLEKSKQVALFWQGVLIGQRLEGQSLIECRQIDGFYVEYKILEKHSHNLRCFQNPDLLHPYLNSIDIEQLLTF
ncbi:MAG TPA: hypothetical protein VGN63_20950 [Flavisolibacter sp.]|jgi:hypothetical protein|nr:hypothetical protein [Flavisolibacter sp.]